MSTHIACRALLAMLLAAISFVSHAQEESSEENTVYAIEVKPDDRIPEGRSAFLQGEADAKGQKLLLEGLYLDDPISISVFTEHPGEKVRVRLVKDSWDKPERDAETDDERRVDFQFRTFDGFKIWITADTPTPYQLVVWVGDKVQLPVPSIAVPASDYREGQGASSPAAPEDASIATPAAPTAAKAGVSLSYLELGLIAALLLVVIAFGAFLLLRRKPGQGS